MTIGGINPLKITNVSPAANDQADARLEKRPLGKTEAAVDILGKNTLVSEVKPGENKATDSYQDLLPPTDLERAALQSSANIIPDAIVIAKEDVQQMKTSSIHDKFDSNLPAMTTNDALNCVVSSRKFILEQKEEYRKLLGTLPTPMALDIFEILEQGGKLEKCSGGLGGVYFLSNSAGKKEYVIKPFDEVNGALNNGKNHASPFIKGADYTFENQEEIGVKSESFSEAPTGEKDINDETAIDGEEEEEENVSAYADDPGIHIYETAKNAQLAFTTAKLLEIPEATPETEIMIIEHQDFHDILDGIKDAGVDDIESKIPTSKEKVCTVQKYIPGCEDLGSILIKKAGSREKYEALSEADKLAMTPTFDPSQFEAVAILALVIGETDGNSGNLMSATMSSGAPGIFKIDNAASFPDHNQALTTGIIWAEHNYKEKISDKAVKIILNIKENEIVGHMRSLNKSEKSIQAFEERVELLKEMAPKNLSWAEMEEAFNGLLEK